MLAALTSTLLAFQLAPLAPQHAPVALRAAPSSIVLALGDEIEGTTPSNVGEAKVAFQAAYGRPVNGPMQGFVGEMLTSASLAMVVPSYKPSRVFYLGIDSLCTVFLEESTEKDALYNALCAGLGLNAEKMKAEAGTLAAFATGKTEDELFAGEDLSAIVAAGDFKYSYPLGAGLLALMPLVDVEPSDEVIERWATKLSLPATRWQKDYAFYKDAQEKLVQVKQMMMEMAAATKRKEAQKLKDEAAKAAKEAAEAEEAAAA